MRAGRGGRQGQRAHPEVAYRGIRRGRPGTCSGERPFERTGVKVARTEIRRGQRHIAMIGMIPAFGNIELQPSGQLSQSVQAWAGAGKVYSWNQYKFSGDFRDSTLAPIYNQFANGQISKAEFVDLLVSAFESR